MEERGAFYVNQVQMVCSSVDALFSFQRMGLVMNPATKVAEVQLAETIQVSMSLPEVKTLIAVMYEQIVAVEKKVGPVPLDSDNQKRYDEFLTSARGTK